MSDDYNYDYDAYPEDNYVFDYPFDDDPETCEHGFGFDEMCPACEPDEDAGVDQW